MRDALTAVGGVLTIAGLADLGLMGLQLDPNASARRYLSSVSSSSASSIQNQFFLPDYLDFLEWVKSVSDKIPGKSVDISLEVEFTPYGAQALDLSFLEYSQINDGYSLLPYLVQLEAVSVMLSTKSPTYDVFSVDNQNLGSFQSGVVSPLDLAKSYPELTYPKYDNSDFMSTVWNYVATYPPITNASSGGGNPTANLALLPFGSPLMVFFYRKDIYAKLGLSPPTSWDEYFDQVKHLQGHGTPYSSVSMANGDISVVYEYLNHLASFGGNMWEVDGNTIIPAMDSDKCVAALENFVRFGQYADPGSHTYTWTDQFTSLAVGTSATGLLWHDYYDWLNDPVRSPVAPGQFASALNPAGPSGSFSTYGGSGLGVSRYSKNPQAAYVWEQWATCKGAQEMMALGKYHIFPTRTSVFSVREIESASNNGSLPGLNVARQAWMTGTTALIPFPRWLEVLVPLSTHLTNAWTGVETPKAALTNAKNQIDRLFPSLTF